MKPHTRPSDCEDSFSNHIDQRDPQAAEAELVYAARYQQNIADDNPEEFAQREQACELIREVLKSLNPRDQDYIKMYFGIGCRCMTLEEIGKNQHISGSRVGSVIRKALRILRHPIRSGKLLPLLDGLDEEHRTPAEVKKAKVTRPHPIFGPNPDEYLVPRAH